MSLAAGMMKAFTIRDRVKSPLQGQVFGPGRYNNAS